MKHTELVYGKTKDQLDNLSADQILRALVKDVDSEDVMYLMRGIINEEMNSV